MIGSWVSGGLRKFNDGASVAQGPTIDRSEAVMRVWQSYQGTLIGSRAVAVMI
jgi:hypothetical protein